MNTDARGYPKNNLWSYPCKSVFICGTKAFGLLAAEAEDGTYRETENCLAWYC
jgi:hypothetical protein